MYTVDYGIMTLKSVWWKRWYCGKWSGNVFDVDVKMEFLWLF